VGQVTSRPAVQNQRPAYGPNTGFAEPHVQDDSLKLAGRVGWIIIFLFFGVLGTWSMIAPLNGAVVANGIIKVEGNRKSVQHLDGGIVKELCVKDGDVITAGQVLIVLDDTQARAEYEVLAEQYAVLRASEVRLRAELTHASEIEFPPDLADRRDDPYVKNIWNGQLQQFETRRSALESQHNIIRDKIAQLNAQIEGEEAQVKAYSAQLESVENEKNSITALVDRGLIARPRVLQLERTGAGLEGSIGEGNGNIAKAKQAIAEQSQQDLQLDHDRMTEVTKDLRDIQAKLVEVVPRLMSAKAVLNRMEIRAPYSGQVVGLNVFSVGGVIGKGDKILDIVPEQDSLVVEAQVVVEDISEIHPDMRAEVHLTAYKQRINPIIHGDVIQVSADRLTEQRTGNPYYTALVRVDEQELADMPNVHLYPGMPATVMVPTTERTAMDYIVGPLAQSFNRAFRQR
jgi:HlyD family type I secretion membrane fusion protein